MGNYKILKDGKILIEGDLLSLKDFISKEQKVKEISKIEILYQEILALVRKYHSTKEKITRIKLFDGLVTSYKGMTQKSIDTCNETLTDKIWENEGKKVWEIEKKIERLFNEEDYCDYSRPCVNSVYLLISSDYKSHYGLKEEIEDIY